MSLIEIRKLWKNYPDKTVLEDVSLSVEDNEFVTIVGASGCGKTTFLRILLGEIKADKGEIKLEGTPLATEPTADRGVVFQRYSLFPHLTALGNVLLSLDFTESRLLGRTLGRKKAANKAIALEMLDRVGLARAAYQYPSELSGGMQQRLALAQTLIARPRILLLDEPFGALDPGIRTDMHTLVRSLHQDLELTVFMVTHDLSEGFSLGTRLLVFDKPRVDPHEPDLYGATITFDLPVGHGRRVESVVNELNVNPNHVEDFESVN